MLPVHKDRKDVDGVDGVTPPETSLNAAGP